MNVTETLRSPTFAQARKLARTWAHQHVDRPITGTVRVASSLRRNASDIIYFGDSSLLHISPLDTDRRRIGEMLADDIQLPIAQFYGPGYPPAVFAEAARLFARFSGARAIVVSMAIRPGTQLHVSEHPVYGYTHARRVLTSAEEAGPLLLSQALRAAPKAEDYRRFEALQRTSRWGGERTIGDYRRALKGFRAKTADHAQRALIFDYFHGEYSAGSPGIDDWRRLGANLSKFGVPVVAYRTYMPLQMGTRVIGEDFAAHIEQNFRAVESAFLEGLEGAGSMTPIQPPADEHFIEPRDATEHLNQEGRLALVKQVAASLRREMA